MGQNSSTAVQGILPRRRPKDNFPRHIQHINEVTTPQTQEHANEVTPTKTPNYVIAENKVIPNGQHDMNNARKNLRPVSQELAKFHPEFAEVFQHPLEVGQDSTKISYMDEKSADKENSLGPYNSVQMNSSPTAEDNLVRSNSLNYINFSSFTTNDQISNYSTTNGMTPGILNMNSVNHHTKSSSLDNSYLDPGRVPKHKRQSSQASRGSIQEIILEDPREHLYSPARNVPFSNFQPNTASLPVKSTFDIDYSLNLTYAQLAEFRRNSRMAEMEERTGRKIKELEAELMAQSSLPKSPFNIQNRGLRSTLSVSTASSDTGVSKSKKKRAPSPPGRQPASNDQSPGKFPVAPPLSAHKAMNMPAGNIQERRSFQSNSSLVSKSSKGPAPQPMTKNKISISNQERELIISSGVNPPHLPATLPRPTYSKAQNDVAPKLGTSSVQDSLLEAKALLETIKNLQNILKQQNPPEPHITHNEIGNAPVDDRTDVVTDLLSIVDNEKKINNSLNKNDGVGTLNRKETFEKVLSQVLIPPMPETHTEQFGTPAADINESPRRMNSLLLNDIILAAQARSSKFVNEKPPATYENPTDTSYDIENQLSEPSRYREDRTTCSHFKEEIEQNEKESKQNSKLGAVFQPNFFTVPKKRGDTSEGTQASANALFNKNDNFEADVIKSVNQVEKFDSKVIQSISVIDHDFFSSSGSMDYSKRSSVVSEDMSVASSTASQRVFSSDWAPEQDLDSNDDMNSEQFPDMTRRISLEGFKPSIIPHRISDLKTRKSRKRSKKREKRETAIPVDNEKLGNVRKLKKSMQENMRNAIGSLSKASGKFLKRQKSEEFLDSKGGNFQMYSFDINEDFDSSRNSNWILSCNSNGSLRRAVSDGFIGPRKLTEALNVDIEDVDFRYEVQSVNVTANNQNHSPAKGHNQKIFQTLGEIYIDKEENVIGGESNLHDKTHKEELSGFDRRNQEYKEQSIEEGLISIEGILKSANKYTNEEHQSKALTQTERNNNYMRQDYQEEEKYKLLHDHEAQISQVNTVQPEQKQDLQAVQQEENNNIIALPSLNKINIAMGESAPDAVYVSAGQFSSPLPYIVNTNSNVLRNDILNTPYHIGNSLPFGYQPHYGITSLTPPALVQAMPVVGVATNMSEPNRLASFVHGTPFAYTYMPRLTPQECAYLTNYMQMLGVSPPTNEQQWAVLLNSIRQNPGGSQTQIQVQCPAVSGDTAHSQTSRDGKAQGDIANGREKISASSNQGPGEHKEISLISSHQGDGISLFHFHDSIAERSSCQQTSQISSNEQPPQPNSSDGRQVYQQTSSKIWSNERSPYQHTSFPNSNDECPTAYQQPSLEHSNEENPTYKKSDTERPFNQQTSTTTQSSSPESSTNSIVVDRAHPALSTSTFISKHVQVTAGLATCMYQNSNPDEHLNSLSRDLPTSTQPVSSQSSTSFEKFPAQPPIRTNFLSPKVYGPIGFRSVSFQPVSKRP